MEEKKINEVLTVSSIATGATRTLAGHSPVVEICPGYQVF